MHEPGKHYRVALSEVRESSSDGVYLTKDEIRKYGIFAGLIVSLLTIFAVFNRKG